MTKHNSTVADHGANHGPHATHGVDPHVTLETHTPQNGADKAFQGALHELVGKIRFGWAVGVAVLSTILSGAFLLVTLAINGGWLNLPARDVDLRTLTVLVQAETARLDKKLDGIEHKIDMLVEKHLKP